MAKKQKNNRIDPNISYGNPATVFNKNYSRQI